MAVPEAMELQEIRRPVAPVDEIRVLQTEILNSQFGTEKRRFFLLFCTFMLSFMNSVTWISFAPVGNYVNAYYGEGAAVWFSVMFMVCSFAMSPAGFYIANEVNYMVLMNVTGVMNALGGIMRILSSIEAADYGSRFWICMGGQVTASFAYPFIIGLPAKTALIWFPLKERTIAVTIGLMGAPMGVMAANLLAPWIVQSSDDIQTLNNIVGGLSFVFGCMNCFTQKETPGTHPHLSSDQVTMHFSESVIRCARNKNYMIIFVVLGSGIGMFNTLYTMMLEMMCPTGYANNIAGLCAVAMISCGVVGSLIAGKILDWKQCHLLLLRVSLIAATVLGVVFLFLTRFAGLSYLLIVVAGSFGFAGLSAYSVGLVVAGECTFPASPDAVFGMICLIGQVFSIVFVCIIRAFAVPMTIDEIQNGDNACQAMSEDAINVPKTYDVPIIIITVVATLLVIPLYFLKPNLKRIRLEESRKSREGEGIVMEGRTSRERAQPHTRVIQVVGEMTPLTTTRGVRYTNL